MGSGVRDVAEPIDRAKIEVLVADDSPLARMFLIHLLESDSRIQVVGAVGDGRAALDFVKARKPDVVLMDIHMPHLDGFEATRLIMEAQPVPIIICSGTSSPSEAATVFRMMDAGAVACIQKPVSPQHDDFEGVAAELLQTVRLMSEVKVVRRWSRAVPSSGPAPHRELPAAAERIELIGIGASTGGPLVLQAVLGGLSKDFSAPILVVQHIARGFLPGLADWLNGSTGLDVRLASAGVLPLPGHVYLAPDDHHMGIDGGGRIMLSKAPAENGSRPAVSFLFRSLAEICGRRALGVLLTGMGTDGAAELKLMKDAGAMTVAQDRESSVVHGMPGAAIRMGGASRVLAANEISRAIETVVSERDGKGRLR